VLYVCRKVVGIFVCMYVCLEKCPPENLQHWEVAKAIQSNRKRCKRWVEHRTYGARTENARARACFNMCTAVHDKLRQGKSTKADNGPTLRGRDLQHEVLG